MNYKLIIFGASDLADIIIRSFPNQVHCCLVDDSYKSASELRDTNIFTLSEFLSEKNDLNKFRVVVSLGYNALVAKRNVVKKLSELGFKFCDLYLNWEGKNSSKINFQSECGNIFFPNVGIEVGTSIGSHNIFWSQSHLCHDSKVISFNFFASRSILGGFAEVKDLCFLGFNSVVDSRIILKD